MRVLFVAGFGPIASDVAASRRLYKEVLGLPFEEDEDGYLHSEGIEGVKHLAVWPLSQAAQSCFGTPEWPAEIPVPQAWIEFDVQDVEAATRELQEQGYEVLVSARSEPWGQVVTRLLGPEGMLVGVVYTPWMRSGTPG
jgi:catechol 2,3-dioxygenase-like lactoylglutathione lyase family enzyme